MLRHRRKLKGSLNAVLRIRITLMRIRILLFTVMRIRIIHFILMRIRILPLNFMRIWIRILPLTFFSRFGPSKMTIQDFHLLTFMRIRIQNDADRSGSATLLERLTSRLQMLELNASLVPDMSWRSPMVVRVRVGSLRLPRRMSRTLSGVRSLRLRIS